MTRSTLEVVASACEDDCGLAGFQAWDAQQWQLGKGFYHNHEGSVYQLHAHCNSWALICVMVGMLATKCKKWKGEKVWWWIYVHVAFELASVMFVTVGFITAAVFHPNDRPLAHLYLKNPHSILGLTLVILWWLNPIFGYFGYIWTVKGPFYYKKNDSKVFLGTICKKIHNLSGRFIFIAGLAQGAMGLAHNLYPEGATMDQLGPFIFYFILILCAVGAYPYLKYLRTYYKKVGQTNKVTEFAAESESEANGNGNGHTNGYTSGKNSSNSAVHPVQDSDMNASPMSSGPAGAPVESATHWPVGFLKKSTITWSFIGLLGGGLSITFALLLSLGAATEWMVESVPLGVKMDVRLEPSQVVAGEPTQIRLEQLSDSSGDAIEWGQLVLEHGRKMHMVCVSEDFTSMGHIHPDDQGPLPDNTSSFTLQFTFPNAGKWICGVDALVRYDKAKAFWQSTLRHISKHFFVEVTGAPVAGPALVHHQGMLFGGLPETVEDSQPLPADISGQVGDYRLVFVAPYKVVGKNLLVEGARHVAEGSVLALQESIVTFELQDPESGVPMDGFVPYLQVPVHLIAVHESLQHYMHLHGWKYEKEDEIGSVGAIVHKHIHPTVANDASFKAKFYAHLTLSWEGRWTILCQAKRKMSGESSNEIVSFAFSVYAE